MTYFIAANFSDAYSLYDPVKMEAEKQAEQKAMKANGIEPFSDEQRKKIQLQKNTFDQRHNPDKYAYDKAQQELVDSYHLPYQLPRSATKIFPDFIQALKIR